MTTSADGQQLVTADVAGDIRMFDAKSLAPVSAPMRHGRSVWSLALSRDSQILASGGDDGAVRLWASATGVQIGEPIALGAPVKSVALSADGRILAAAAGNAIHVMSLPDRKPLGLIRPGGAIWAIAMSADGTMLAEGDIEAGLLGVYDIPSLKRRPSDRITAHRGITSIAISPDGRQLAIGTLLGQARIINARSLEVIGSSMGHPGPVFSVAFSPDGRLLATGWGNLAGDGIPAAGGASLWDASSGVFLGRSMRHDERVVSLAYLPGGRTLVTASTDRTVRLWSTPEVLVQKRADVVRLLCGTTLAEGRDEFDEAELKRAPVLDQRIDSAACAPPGFWERLSHALGSR